MRRVLLAAVVAVLLAGCQRPDVPTVRPQTPSPAPAEIVVALAPGLELVVLGTEVALAPAANDCTTMVHRLATPTGRYQAAVLGADCTAGDAPGNGFHGYFPAPPRDAQVERAATPVGPALVFGSEYDECTNSCATGIDQVALVDVGGRTLQVIAETSPSGSQKSRERADLVELLQGLRTR